MSLSDFEILQLEVSGIFISLCAIICTIISLILIYQLLCDKSLNIYGRKKKNVMPLSSKLLVITCISASTLQTWGDLIRHLICFIVNRNIYYYPLNNYMCIADLFYFTATLSFYIIAISRVYITFKTTTYSLNNFVLLLFGFLIFLSFILSIYYVIIVALSPNPATHFFDTYDLPIVYIMMGLDCTLNTSLLILFIWKLRDVLSMKLVNFGIVRVTGSELASHGVYEEDNIFRLFTLITRHTLLFGIAIITNQMWSIGLILADGIYHNKHYPNPFTIFCFRSLESTANCIALLLSFKTNEGLYIKCCKCCHNKFEKCIICCVQCNLDHIMSEKKQALNQQGIQPDQS